MNKNATYYREKLGLTQHVEGGSFAESYRSELLLKQECLNTSYSGNRQASTGIYFLLEHGEFSAFHKISSDEMWHFYEGAPLCIYEIEADGHLVQHKLGRNLEAGESFQCVIKGGHWFASRCEVKGEFSLVACTVAPGFDFADFVLAEQVTLSKEYPQHSQLISELCK